jgi:hypothetical protein
MDAGGWLLLREGAMKAVLAWIGLAVCLLGASGSVAQLRLPTTSHPPVMVDGRGTESAPAVVRILAAEHDYWSSEWWLVYLTGSLAAFTLGLMIYTSFLWGITKRVGKDAKDTAERQAAQTQESLSISRAAANAAKESAEVAIKTAMPLLRPNVVSMFGLHPLLATTTDLPKHESVIHLHFDNFGKSPAFLRAVRAELFLTRDNLPSVDWDALATRDQEVMVVPGDGRARDYDWGALELRQNTPLSAHDLDEILAEAKTRRYRRFFLAGEVVYDDFFGQRHWSRFCLKLRLWGTNTHNAEKNVWEVKANAFQATKGGSEYNRVETRPIPAPDPLSA